MNGAEALIQTLADNGVEVCFANPGTSEMQLVAALDGQPKMRAVLGLFEGVVTGAADGYGRMAEKPAAALLHLGPGLANGLANLHNAKRAHTPIINIVGDHATEHLQFDAPLTSDIVGVATPMSHWVRTSTSPQDLADAGAQAVAAAFDQNGQIATIIAPADHAWTEGATPAAPNERQSPAPVKNTDLREAAELLKENEGAETALFLGGNALRESALVHAGRIAAKTGARLICETFPARWQRGAGRVVVERLPYFGEMAADVLKDFKRLIFVGAKPPVSFFAYPDKPSEASPADATKIQLASPIHDTEEALRQLAQLVDAPEAPAYVQPKTPAPHPDGAPDTPLDPLTVGSVIAKHLPENAIVSDEANTAGLALLPTTAGAAPHDWMCLTGGAIGQGLPLAVGAAIACPDRKVLALQADGSAMYTCQALWTMARENLDVTTVIFNNGSYAILNIEFGRVGVTAPGEKALSLLDLTNPTIDWVKLSESMGVPADRVDTAAAFDKALATALSAPGPRLIEAIVPKF